MSQAVLETVWISDIDVLRMDIEVPCCLETVYIADIHEKWSNLAISRLSRDESGYSNWHIVARMDSSG